MLTLQVRIWAENAGDGVRQLAAETMGIEQAMGGLMTQWKNNKVRERVEETAQSMSIGNKQGAGREPWDLPINCCLTRHSDLASKRPLWGLHMADKTNVDGQKHKAALDQFVEVGVRPGKKRINETTTKKGKFVHVGMYFIALMLLMLFLMMCRYR